MAPAPAALAAEPVSGEAAFDIATASDGAAIALGQTQDGHARIKVSFVDPLGSARGKPAVVDVPAPDGQHVVEVALASTGARLGIAWLTAGDRGAESWGTTGDPTTHSFAPAMGLGSATLGDESQRGHLALAAGDRGELMLLRRGPDEPCLNQKDRTCASFDFRELLSTGPEHRGLPLAVPAACGRPLAGVALVGDRWHYAVCSEEDGHPAITAFNVQRKPYYAEAKKLLEGCTPLGMTVLGDQVVIAGDCAEGRRAMLVAGMGFPPIAIELGKGELYCERGRPVLKAPGVPPLIVVFDTPKDGLAPLLPPTIAPGNARAVWTGSSLLVATWMRKSVVLNRYDCRGGRLDRF